MAPAANALDLKPAGSQESVQPFTGSVCVLLKLTYIHACTHDVVTGLTVSTIDVGRTR